MLTPIYYYILYCLINLASKIVLDTLVIQLKKLPCFQNLPLHIGDLNPENAHPFSSHFPELISHVSLFLQWLHVLEQLTSYVPVSQPINENKINMKMFTISTTIQSIYT